MATTLTPGAVASTAVVLFASYVLGTVLYRVFFGPLSRLPGPTLASLTYCYECYYDVVQPAQYVFRIKQLHDRYGPVVRITPSEVSISNPEFLDVVYAPGPGQKRDKDLRNVRALGINTSLGGAVPHDLHRKRREALAPFFSHSNIVKRAQVIQKKVDQLEAIFEVSRDVKTELTLSDVYFGFANDIVNEYCFGQDSNLLGDLGLCSRRRNSVDGVLRSVKFNTHFSWVRDLMRMLPTGIGKRFAPPGIGDMIRFRIGIRKEIQRILSDDVSSNVAKKGPSSIFHELRDSTRLPPAEKSAQRLEDEATLLVMAGTQSTQLSLTMAHYHLLANPPIMAKLRDELATSPSSTLSELQSLPYLNGVIQEAHRLGFGLTGRNARISPEKEIVYDRGVSRYVFPPGTSMSISTLLVHANGDIFPKPYVFDPERWLGPEGASRRRYQMAFSRGPRACIGMHLANAEMTLAIAAMARWDMGLVETDDNDVAFLHDYHIATPKLESRGVRASVQSRVTQQCTDS